MKKINKIIKCDYFDLFEINFNFNAYFDCFQTTCTVILASFDFALLYIISSNPQSPLPAHTVSKLVPEVQQGLAFQRHEFRVQRFRYDDVHPQLHDRSGRDDRPVRSGRVRRRLGRGGPGREYGRKWTMASITPLHSNHIIISRAW